MRSARAASRDFSRDPRPPYFQAAFPMRWKAFARRSFPFALGVLAGCAEGVDLDGPGHARAEQDAGDAWAQAFLADADLTGMDVAASRGGGAGSGATETGGSGGGAAGQAGGSDIDGSAGGGGDTGGDGALGPGGAAGAGGTEIDAGATGGASAADA